MKQLRITSNAITHPGKVRANNEDHYLLQAEVGVWMVADGMGGHERGEYASGLVTEPIRVTQPFQSLEEGVTRVKAEVQKRHQQLVEYAAAQNLKTVCGCTVVALVVFGDRKSVV